MDKKAQEEMVGFVLIVILVVVISVVFLGISLRGDSSSQQESLLISSFLNSISQYTTACEIPESVFKSVGDLVVECNNNQLCSNGKTACEVLDGTLKGVLENSFLVSNSSYTRYYGLSLGNNDTSKEILNIVKGNGNDCPAGKLYNQRAFNTGSRDDILIMKLEICNSN